MSYQYDYPHFAVTTDVVMFSLRAGSLHVLLIRRGEAPFRGRWALPGGFLQPGESLDDCATRELQEETGVSGYYLEQLYTFGALRRDPRERVISVAYFALIRSDELQLTAATDAEDARWWPVADLPRLAFDHADILAMAHERLAAKLEYSNIALQFLPGRFTMRQLHEIYEAVLGGPVDRRNFYKRMLATGDLVETGEQRVEGAHRPATVYRLRDPAAVRITR